MEKKNQDLFVICVEKRRGVNSNFWNGGITKLRLFIANRTKTWKRKSAKLCEYKCIITGDIKYEVHHLYPLNKIIEDAFFQLNIRESEFINYHTEDDFSILLNKIEEIHYQHSFGVCLRKDIHKLFHKIYGDDCDPEDFYEFYDKVQCGEIKIKN